MTTFREGGLRQGGISIAQPNDFEKQYRPEIIQHLPPLSATQPAYSEKPKILERGSWTKAAPIKEQKFVRNVSDSIGNNYSPTARDLTTSVIYENTRFGPQAEEGFCFSPRAQQVQSAQQYYSSPSPSPQLLNSRQAVHSSALIDTQDVTDYRPKTSHSVRSSKHNDDPSYSVNINNNRVDKQTSHPIITFDASQGTWSEYGNYSTTLPPLLQNPDVSPRNDSVVKTIRFQNGFVPTPPKSPRSSSPRASPPTIASPRRSPLGGATKTNGSHGDDTKSEDSGRPLSTATQPANIQPHSRAQKDIEDSDDEGFSTDNSPGHDKQTKNCLSVEFPPWYCSTTGLSRPSTPDECDNVRYYSLVERSIENKMIAPVQSEWIDGIYSLVPNKLLSLKDAKELFLEEMDVDYKAAVKKAVLDYVLLDKKEQVRLGIPLPIKPSNSAGRFSYPWHETVNEMREFMKIDVYITHPVMQKILIHFETNYSKFRLIDLPGLKEIMPVTMETFLEYVRTTCARCADVLNNKWITECCDIVDSHRDDVEEWMPDNDTVLRMKKMDHFFNSCASLSHRLPITRSRTS